VIDDSAPKAWDSGRAVLPHKDPTFDAVAKLLEQGEPITDWKLTGPSMVRPDGGKGVPAISPQSVRLNLSAGATRAVLQFLSDVAEVVPSRSGNSSTVHLKRGL
jgi:hypothetical protein